MFNFVTFCHYCIFFRRWFVLGSFPICYYLCIGDIAAQFKFYFTMSKGNMMLGYASGKVGSLVFARRMGQQITRPYNGSPKNPQTLSQMRRRIKWANLVNMWRLMKPFISMGMQGRKTTQSDYNKFVSLNVNHSDAYLLKDEARQGATLLAPYVITSGTLGLRSMSLAAVTSISVGDITNLANVTIGQLSEAIIQNNQGFQIGDQITVFALGQELVEGLPRVVPSAFKFLLVDPGVAATALDAIEVFGSVAPTVEDGFLAYEFAGVEYSSYAGAVVQSRISPAGELLVSDSRLAVVHLIGGVSQSVNPFAASQDEVLASYGYTPDAFLSPASAATVAVRSSITSVSFDGTEVANRGSFSPTENIVDVVLTGVGFDESAPVASFNDEQLQVVVVSPTSATCQFEPLAGNTAEFVATAQAGQYSAVIRG